MSIMPFPRGSDELADRLPPHDLDAEMATLAACMLEPKEMLPVVRRIVGAEDFYRGYHQDIFRAILAVDARGNAPCIITVNDELRLRGITGGTTKDMLTLGEMLEKFPLAYRAADYATIVRNLAYKRQVIERAEELLSQSYDPSVGAGQLREAAQSSLLPLTSIEGVSGWDYAPDLDLNPPAPPFPLDFLPGPLVDLARHAARIYPCPPDYLAVPCLALVGGVIGRSMFIRIKDDWAEAPNLFATVVGGPGTAKSPALKLVSGPIWAIHEELMEDHKHRAEEIRLDNLRQDALRKAIKGASLADYPHQEPPALQRIVTGDATCEGLAVLLRDNPRGIIMIRDELSGWINGFNQYKSGNGNDRDFYLQLWNGSPIPIDRKGQEDGVPIYVSHPVFCLVGPTTPDKVKSMPCEKGQKPCDDGFMDRLLICYPDEVIMTWTWDVVADELVGDWGTALRKLWERSLRLNKQGHIQPFFKALSAPAKKEWEKWMLDHIKETQASDFPTYLRGPWSKFRAYCARLTLILDQLNWAYDPTGGDGLRAIEAVSVRGAAALISYFKAHYRRMLGLVEGARADNPDARAILQWAITRGELRFRESDAADNFRRRFEERPDDFQAALRWLESRHCIRKVIELPRAGQRGPRGRGSFELHPRLLP
jgi:Protein of unknown function (DUF3987)/DnaB-like helicase N terminal domain